MTDSTDTTPKTRGRKSLKDGGTPSPRKIKVVCAAIVDGELVMTVYDGEPGSREPSEVIVEAAKKTFAKEQGIDESEISTQGPFYPREGTQVPKEKKREAGPDLDFSTISLKKGYGSAVYKDWNMTVRFIEGNDDCCWATFKSHTKEDKKSLPNSRPIFIKDLQDLVVHDS